MLEISSNLELRSLTGLENLSEVSGSTTIMSNPLLEDISSLGGLG